MIKIILKIKEKKQKLTNNFSITQCEVNATEIGNRYTKAEKKCCDILKKRMNLGENEAINLTSEKNSDKIINELLKNIL